MKTKEMIKWLEDMALCFIDEDDKTMFAAIIKSLQHYETLKDTYEGLLGFMEDISNNLNRGK